MSTPVIIALLGSAILLIIGGLVGHSLSQYQLERQIRRQAALQRTLGEQWRSLQADRAGRRRDHSLAGVTPVDRRATGSDSEVRASVRRTP